MQNKNVVKVLNIIATVFFCLFLFGSMFLGLYLIQKSFIEIGLIVFVCGTIIGLLGFIFILAFSGILEELIEIRTILEKTNRKHLLEDLED
ncbi:MAG: hypothetical protein J6C26_02315 [Clostridia bacterium]|nr:hypothetical protein [Clostridia bacterium]MBQ4322345.1 hypothetical protein [Clostridia bacterium]